MCEQQRQRPDAFSTTRHQVRRGVPPRRGALIACKAQELLYLGQIISHQRLNVLDAMDHLLGRASLTAALKQRKRPGEITVRFLQSLLKLASRMTRVNCRCGLTPRLGEEYAMAETPA